MKKNLDLCVQNYLEYIILIYLVYLNMVEKKDGVLICNQEESKLALKTIPSNDNYFGYDMKGYSQLFDQTKKACVKSSTFNDRYFEDIYVNIDFKEFINNYKTKKEFTSQLETIKNGIELYVGDKKIHVVDFLKSNSMSKECCVYYINKDYYDKVYPRVSFGMDEGDVTLSKWYAYSGLSISDATILEGVKLTKEEIVIIPDKEKNVCIDCITATSLRYIYQRVSNYIDRIDKIRDYKEYKYEELLNKQDNRILISNVKEMQDIYNEITCFINSLDYKTYMKSFDEQNLDTQLVLSILTEFYNIISSDVSIKTVKARLAQELKVKYEEEAQKTEVYWVKFKVNDYPTKITKFDGEGLISKEFCNEINTALKKISNDKEDKLKFGYTYQIRLPFIKGIVSACDIKDFFVKKGIKEIYGKTYGDSVNGKIALRAYDVNKVKLILTESQFKCAGFISKIKSRSLEGEEPIDTFMRLLNEYDYEFGINNLEQKHTDTVSLNYQFFSTIPFSEESIDHILELNEENYKKETSKEALAITLANRSKSEAESKLCLNHIDFYCSTNKYKTNRNQFTRILKKSYLKLKLLANGSRRFICGDLLELLYHVAYHNIPKHKITTAEPLKLNEFYCPHSRFKEEEKCILLRNPHYSRNEIAIMKNSTQANTERKKYFGHLTGVLMYNPIALLADRLGGADFDGDTIVVLSEYKMRKTMDRLISKNNGKLKYPLIKIPGLTAKKVQNNYTNKIDCFFNTFNSRVGIISNNAFKEALELYKDQDIENHDKIAYYTILNGLEIDSAKQGIKPFMGKSVSNKTAEAFIKLKDNLDSLSMDKCEKIINDNKEKHIIFEILFRILDFKPATLKRIKYKKYLNLDGINKKDIKKMIAVYCAYQFVINEMNLVRSKVRRQTNTRITLTQESLNNVLIKKISTILKNKNIEEVSEFINDISDNLGSKYTALVKYCSNEEKRFHYLTNQEEKVDYIQSNLGMVNLKEETLKLLTDFSNEGYMLLYLILCHLNNIESTNNQQSEENKDKKMQDLIEKCKNDLDKRISLDEEDIEEIGIAAKHLRGKINYQDKNFKDAEEEAVKVLEKECENIPFEAYLAFKQINKENIIFTLLSEKLLDYLDAHKGELYA